jgi:hypothetical protein
VSFSAVITFLTSSATPTTAPADIGIAARYPGDKNIASDPAVLFADDFESYTTPDQAKTRWGNGSGTQRMRIVTAATEPQHVFSGAKAIEFKLPISGSEIACQLIKTLSPTQDTVYMRMYQKFAADYAISEGANHNGIRLSANYPESAGTPAPADGTGFFLFLLQNAWGTGGTNEPQPGYTDIYAYWPQQRSSFGDHWYPNGRVLPGGTGDWLLHPDQYPDFVPYPMFAPIRDRWYCVELMVKANTPGQNNGEVKFWIDGKVVGDFPDLNMRSINSLKIDVVKLILHETKVTSPLTKWHDNVVIATQYIGPMAGPSPSPTPTPTSTAQLQNISSRLLIQTGNNVGIAGFVVG